MDKECTFVRDVKIRIAHDEVLRMLGAGGKGERLREDTFRMVQEGEAMGRELIRPRGVYRILDRSEADQLSPLQGHDRAGLGICTIGPELEEKVRDLMATGREPEGYVLDAVGSVAVEAAADAVNARICHWAAAHHLAATPRRSPGYGKWLLEEQRIVFGLLPAAEIGMSLNPSCMMIPRKSISFAVTFTRDTGQAKSENLCEGCGLENCPFRKK
jgi:hypothetical protein